MALPGRSRREPEPVRITNAPSNYRDDLNRRRRAYGISMGVRTLCFIGAIVVGSGWLRWGLVAGALILPYFAVVMANTSNPRIPGTELLGSPGEHKELGP
jgi:hypothetical protein